MDNWGLMQVAFRDIQRLEYIIAAVHLSDSNDDEVSTNDILNEVVKIKDVMINSFKRSSAIEQETSIVVADIQAN